MSPNSDPRLIKAQIESIQSAIQSLKENGRKSQAQIADPHTRQALVSLECAVDLMSVLVRIAIDPYLQELEQRIKSPGKGS